MAHNVMLSVWMLQGVGGVSMLGRSHFQQNLDVSQFQENSWQMQTQAQLKII